MLSGHGTTIFLKKIEASVDIDVDLQMGTVIIRQTMDAYPNMAKEDNNYLKTIVEKFSSKELLLENKIESIISTKLYQSMIRYPLKNHVTRFEKSFEISVERKKPTSARGTKPFLDPLVRRKTNMELLKTVSTSCPI